MAPGEPGENGLRARSDLIRISAADVLVRTGYQIGKTPLLPLYAAMLGASDLIIGYVVSISTLTGLVLKPLVGWLSDRGGRRLWLLIGLALFGGIPFLYATVEGPGDLYVLRLIHGTATAIFGPVSLAYVAELGAARRGERLGIFGMARSASYLMGPILGAALLTALPPEQVFTLIGAVSLLAFIPGLGLKDAPAAVRRRPVPLLSALRGLSLARGFWLAAALEISVYITTYAIKAFLPLYALRALGMELILIGLFFSLQEAAHMAARPFGGRLADRFGPTRVIGPGLLALAAALAALALEALPLPVIALLIGAGLGLVLPATLLLVSGEVQAGALGASMGAMGALRNLAKIAGPVMAGTLLIWLDYAGLFAAAALFMGATALLFNFVGTRRLAQAGR